MDINALYNISSGAVREAYESYDGVKSKDTESKDTFAAFFQNAMENIETTNAYLSDAENEEVRLALGETESTHDLTIALEKASMALQYTVAVRDKFLEAYNSIMQMQI